MFDDSTLWFLEYNSESIQRNEGHYNKTGSIPIYLRK